MKPVPFVTHQLAWDIAATPEGQDLLATHRMRVVGGHVEWEGAYVTRTGTVCLQRLVKEGRRFREIRRYVAWDTVIEIVPMDYLSVLERAVAVAYAELVEAL